MAQFNRFRHFIVGLPSPLEIRSRRHSTEPKEGTMNPTVPASDLPIVDQLRMAERELSAFFTAVEILFGPKQAKLSTEDWLDATEQVFGRNQPTQRDWRAVTIIASSRLAHRLVVAR
jgi:hypothetical protein